MRGQLLSRREAMEEEQGGIDVGSVLLDSCRALQNQKASRENRAAAANAKPAPNPADSGTQPRGTLRASCSLHEDARRHLLSLP